MKRTTKATPPPAEENNGAAAPAPVSEDLQRVARRAGENLSNLILYDSARIQPLLDAAGLRGESKDVLKLGYSLAFDTGERVLKCTLSYAVRYKRSVETDLDQEELTLEPAEPEEAP